MLLSVEELIAGYGDVRVLHGISLGAREGEITALIGANGAGKTTLFRTLAGLLPSDSGSIHFRQKRLDVLPTHERVVQGVVLVPEGRLVFADMSVADNLRLGAINDRARHQWRATVQTVYQLFPRLKERQAQYAGTLSGGEQQMLAIGRGMMAQPKILLLDEPTLGLAPNMATLIFQTLTDLVTLGVTILVAEQDVKRTLQVAQHCFIIENGQVTMDASGEVLMRSPMIHRAFLGFEYVQNIART